VKKRILPALLLLGAVLALPFLLRSGGNPVESLLGKHDVVVVISAHSEPMKHEFEVGFRKYYRAKYNRDVKIDWRAPGGTSDIVRYISDRYEAEFRFAWESDSSNPPWNANIAAAYKNPATLKDPNANDEAKRARRKFLESNVGIGIDIFAGGGTYEHARQARIGYGVDGGIHRRHPEFLKPEIIPQSFGGDELYDKQGRYYGVCLSSFGICCNLDRVKEMKQPVPKRWRDLGRPEFFNTLIAADPTKSGSANKCFEVILQQEMHEAVSPRNAPKPPMEQLDRGWANGMNLIKRILANTRNITDSAGKVTRDVAAGEGALGMAIDFYGLTEQEWNEFVLGKGKSVIAYIAPEGGTAVSADPVQLLRGAPHKEAAEAFIDFLVGPEGQKLLDFKVGTPGGPVKYALRRSPIRRDLYAPKYRSYRADPDYDPYVAGASFTYRGDWTGRYFTMIRILIRCVGLDVQDELRAAWRAIIEAGGPEKVPLAYQEFCKLPFAYHEAAQAASLLKVSRTRTAVEVAAVCRQWSDQARMQYIKAAELAKEGK